MTSQTDTDTAHPTLSTLARGQQATIHSLRGGREFRSRVSNLGFTAGAPIAIVQNYGHGPIIVSLRGTLVALGRQEAGQVVVASDE